jgi:GR25 family glycosyltransferase involved in LPS biosynthesis
MNAAWIKGLFFAASLWAVCPSELGAALEDHFKQATNKGTDHQIRNIDFIYMINLDRRPEKLESCLVQLHPYGINPYRFSAVDGRELSRETLNDIGVSYTPGMATDIPGTFFPLDGGEPIHEPVHVPGRTYFYDVQSLSLGVIGCTLSHLSVLQDAYDSGYQTVWVMEDDISVLRNPLFISSYIDRLDRLVGSDGWDMLFTDQDTISNETGKYVPCIDIARRPNFTPKNPNQFAQRIVLNTDFRKIGARYGMYSFIIQRSGIKKILDFFKTYKVFLPIDTDFFLVPDIKIYTVMDDIISTQRWAPSDNREFPNSSPASQA